MIDGCVGGSAHACARAQSRISLTTCLPGRPAAEQSGVSSTVTVMRPQPGRLRAGTHSSAFTPASMDVRPTLASALPCALPTTPSATLRSETAEKRELGLACVISRCARGCARNNARGGARAAQLAAIRSDVGLQKVLQVLLWVQKAERFGIGSARG
jgi:hypothetical protein